MTQDEPLGRSDDDKRGHHKDDHGHAKTVPDAFLLHGPYVKIRAERDPHGDGRVYTIAFTVTDGSGASCSGTTTVSVPHDEHHRAKLTPGVVVNSLGH